MTNFHIYWPAKPGQSQYMTYKKKPEKSIGREIEVTTTRRIENE